MARTAHNKDTVSYCLFRRCQNAKTPGRKGPSLHAAGRGPTAQRANMILDTSEARKRMEGRIAESTMGPDVCLQPPQQQPIYGHRTAGTTCERITTDNGVWIRQTGAGKSYLNKYMIHPH